MAFQLDPEDITLYIKLEKVSLGSAPLQVGISVIIFHQIPFQFDHNSVDGRKLKI